MERSVFLLNSQLFFQPAFRRGDSQECGQQLTETSAQSLCRTTNRSDKSTEVKKKNFKKQFYCFLFLKKEHIFKNIQHKKIQKHSSFAFLK